MKKLIIYITTAVFFLSSNFFIPGGTAAQEESSWDEGLQNLSLTGEIINLAEKQLIQIFATEDGMIYRPFVDGEEQLYNSVRTVIEEEIKNTLAAAEQNKLFNENVSNGKEHLKKELSSQINAETFREPVSPGEIKEKYTAPPPQEEVLQLTLPEARQKALDNSREAQRARLKLDQLDIAVEMAEEHYEDMKDLQEAPEEMEEDLKEEQEELRDRREKIYEDDGELDEALDELIDAIAEALENNLQEEENNSNNSPNGKGNGEKNNDKEGNNEIEHILDVDWDEFIQEVFQEIEDELDEVTELLSEGTQVQQQLAATEFALHILDEIGDLEMLDDIVAEAEQAKRETKQQREIAQLEWEKNKELIQFQAEAQYVGLLSLQEQKDMEKAALKWTENELKKEKLKAEQGASVDLMVDNLKMELKSKRNTLSSLENEYQDMERELLDTLGKSPEDYDRIKLGVIHYSLEWFEQRFDIEEAEEKVLEQGKEINIAEKRLEFAEENKEWAKDQYGKSSNEYDMAVTEVEEAELKLEEAEANSINKLHKARGNFNDSLNDYEQAAEAAVLSKENLRGEELQEKIGLSSEHELLQAKVEHQQAKGAFQLADYQAYLSKRELQLISSGILLQN